MTKTTRKSRKCESCKSAAVDFKTQGRDSTMCADCFDYAGWENTHTDEQHENGGVDENDPSRKECRVCQRYAAIDRKRTNDNAKGKHFSHASCKHASTKSARAQCRKQRAAEVLPRPARGKLNKQSAKITRHREITVSCPTCFANVSEGEKCKTRTGKIAKQSHADRPSK